MNKGLFQGCHITMVEDLIPIYPWAIIALFSVVEKIIPMIKSTLSDNLYTCLVIWIAGLCLKDRNQTAYGISKALGVVSHDRLNRFLDNPNWNPSHIMFALLRFACSVPNVSCGWLILDCYYP